MRIDCLTNPEPRPTRHQRFLHALPRTALVIECPTVERTFLAIIFAALLSLMLAPHTGDGLLHLANYAHGPFFITPNQIAGKPLLLQTIFFAVAAALIVNIPWRQRKKDDQE